MKVNNPNYLNGLTVSAEQINAVVEGGGAGLTTAQTEALGKIEGLEASANEIDLAVSMANISKFNFLNMFAFTKHWQTVGTSSIVLAAKSSINTITCTTISDISSYAVGNYYAITIKYIDSTYLTYVCRSFDKTTGIIKVDRNLEDKEVHSFMMTHKAISEQHLSDYGYKALAQYSYLNTKTFNSLKSIKYSFLPYYGFSATTTDTKVYDSESNVIGNFELIEGSFSTGTTPAENYGFGYKTTMVDLDMGTCSTNRKRYEVRQAVAGQGVRLPLSLGINGWLEAYIGTRWSFEFSAKSGYENRSNGSVTVELRDSVGNVLNNQIIQGSTERVIFPISSVLEDAFLYFYATNSVATLFSINEIMVCEGSISIEDLNNKSVGALGDSWTQFPLTSTDYVAKPTNPYNGVLAEGYQYLTEEYKKIGLTEDNVITTSNFGRGNQTSTWGKYWAKNLIASGSDYVFVLFYTNDNNSRGNFSAVISSEYDFSPTNPYSSVLFSSGGVFASVDYDTYLSNMLSIRKQLSSMGSKLVIVMPSHTSSGAQSNYHSIMNTLIIESLTI